MIPVDTSIASSYAIVECESEHFRGQIIGYEVGQFLLELGHVTVGQGLASGAAKVDLACWKNAPVVYAVAHPYFIHLNQVRSKYTTFM